MPGRVTLLSVREAKAKKPNAIIREYVEDENFVQCCN